MLYRKWKTKNVVVLDVQTATHLEAFLIKQGVLFWHVSDVLGMCRGMHVQLHISYAEAWFYYYLTLNHGQKMTLLALAIARPTSWLNIIWHFWKKKNGYDITKISSKWTCLKTYIFLMLHNSPNEFYLEIWHQIFINNEVMAECQNMHIFEILMIVPFTTP